MKKSAILLGPALAICLLEVSTAQAQFIRSLRGGFGNRSMTGSFISRFNSVFGRGPRIGAITTRITTIRRVSPVGRFNARARTVTSRLRAPAVLPNRFVFRSGIPTLQFTNRPFGSVPLYNGINSLSPGGGRVPLYDGINSLSSERFAPASPNRFNQSAFNGLTTVSFQPNATMQTPMKLPSYFSSAQRTGEGRPSSIKPLLDYYSNR